jgi:hypothetical protein
MAENNMWDMPEDFILIWLAFWGILTLAVIFVMLYARWT